MSSRKDQLKAIERLLDIMDNLRENCPWDRKQTFQSLRHLTIEETYELGDAILENDYDKSGILNLITFQNGHFYFHSQELNPISQFEYSK